MKAWVVVSVGEEEIHIVPQGDLVEHVMNDECICDPATQYLEGGGKMHTHSSFDGRELKEPDRTV